MTDLCPAPGNCPVVKFGDHAPFRLVEVSSGARFTRCYDATWGYDEFNPGHGDTRFAPLYVGTGPVSSLYAAETDVAALLETVFHDVVPGADRRIYEKDLRGKLLVEFRFPSPITLIDIRNAELMTRGVTRRQLVTSPAEHYPCTRRWAAEAHSSNADAQGIIWHSRQAELLCRGDAEVLVIFGDRYPVTRGALGLGEVRSLHDGSARRLVDRLANALDATLVRP